MDTTLPMNIFFIVTSVGLGIIFIFIIIFFFYIITTLYALRRVIFKIEKNINKIGDVSRDMLEDLRNNKMFNFLFKKNKKHHKN